MELLAQGQAEVERCIAKLQLGVETEENFRLIYTHYYRLVYSFFFRQRITDARCHDLTQEVFLRVYRGIGTFRGEAHFETWLRSISRNLWNSTEEWKAREVSLDAMVEERGTGAVEAR